MLKKILTNIGLLILLVVLCYPMTYLFSLVYKSIISHPVGGTFWGPDPYLLFGFLMSFLFFISLYLVLSLKKFYSIIIIIIINILFLYFFWTIDTIDNLILIISSLLGYLLAELLKFSYKKIKTH